MLDLRPVGYVIGLLVTVLGAAMLLPLLVDLSQGLGHWPVFLESSALTMLCGGFLSLACANGVRAGLSLRETFLLTSSVWVVLPVFGALPFLLGPTASTPVDAFFEAMSALTTTGATVLTGLDDLPRGILLWRGIMQWLGGVGIVVVAMVFLPELRVGGMQIFRSESFETMGKILPRATEIASRISVIYVALTLGCIFSYMATGLSAFDATVHSLTTVSTGGMANSDASFSAYGPATLFVACIFMVLGALPFVLYVQMIAGNARPLLRDSQVRTFLGIILVVVAMLTAVLWLGPMAKEGTSVLTVFFNVISIMTGTGYASVDYMLWGPFAVMIFFIIGLIGGCAGSTSCSVKVFRYQLLIASIRVQLKRIRSPHGVFTPKFEGRAVGEDVLSSVMSFFMFFILTIGLFSVALGLTGLDFITSVSGAATALANVGPGLGPEIGPAGNFAGLNDTAKWILSIGMFIGRLELLAVFVLFTVQFWRA